MKHMRVGRINPPMGPLYYIRDMRTGFKVGRNAGLEKSIKKADNMGIHAHVFRLGKCQHPVHIGTYE